jgi:hypothetical protein
VARLDRAAADVVGAGAAGAVLVRPDARIAWRSEDPLGPSDAVAGLTGAVSV